jgi:hypothetical protein
LQAFGKKDIFDYGVKATDLSKFNWKELAYIRELEEKDEH